MSTRRAAPPLGPASEQADEEPGQRHRAGAEAGIDEQHAERHPERREREAGEHRRAQECGERCRNGSRHQDVLQLGRAREAPEAPVQADVEEHSELEGEADREIDEGRVQVGTAPVQAFEANHVRQHRGEAEEHGVQDEQVTVPHVPRRVEFHCGFNRYCYLA